MRQENRFLPARWFRAALLLIAILAVAAAGFRAWGESRLERSLPTGSARWIWFSLDIHQAAPLRFYAQRDFLLDTAPGSARARLFVDRRGSLTLNGSTFAPSEYRPGSPMGVFEVAPLLVAGVNRAVIEAESPTGAGGILFSLDLPEGKRVVSDGSWRVSLSQSILSRGGGSPARVWGKPPMYPWGYPRE